MLFTQFPFVKVVMAYLINKNTSDFFYINTHHSFGRLDNSVDTLINQVEVSRIHAVIEWDNEYWKLLDLSRNGTWLNGDKLKKEHYYSLKVGDEVYFGVPNQNGFVVKDVDPPTDFLVALDRSADSIEHIIPLKSYNLLPNDEDPEYAIYLGYPNKYWCLEHLNQTDLHAKILKENDLITFSGKRWQLRHNRSLESTRELRDEGWTLDTIELIFNLSMDEEHTSLLLQTPSGSVELDARIYHYLTLSLARYKAEAAIKNITKSEQGWIYTEQLAKDLGLSETYTNIQIHRARKHFTDAMSEHLDCSNFIQRRDGKVRLGATRFKIYKGQKLECACSDQSTQFGNMGL